MCVDFHAVYIALKNEGRFLLCLKNIYVQCVLIMVVIILYSVASLVLHSVHSVGMVKNNGCHCSHRPQQTTCIGRYKRTSL